tara:strand:+ start:835 stop:1161 length:327 start_codon:yes stop_codon:yes gene_type:complete
MKPYFLAFREGDVKSVKKSNENDKENKDEKENEKESEEVSAEMKRTVVEDDGGNYMLCEGNTPLQQVFNISGDGTVTLLVESRSEKDDAKANEIIPSGSRTLDSYRFI